MTLRAMYVAPLVLVGTALAATVFADQVFSSNDEPYAPAVSQPAMAPSEPIVATESAESARPAPELMLAEPASAPVRAQPVVASADTSSTTTVYGERRTDDEFITDDVVKALAAEPRISGKIGVETYRRVVTLTGRVSTQGQVDRITRVAQRAVDRDVEIHNQVMSKV